MAPSRTYNFLRPNAPASAGVAERSGGGGSLTRVSEPDGRA
jgi:hypothetical protein